MRALAKMRFDTIREMDGIQKYHCIDSLQPTILPLLNERQDFVRDVGDESRRNLDSVQVVPTILNLSRAHAFGIKGDDLIFNAGDVGLVLLHHLRLELPLAISGD